MGRRRGPPVIAIIGATSLGLAAACDTADPARLTIPAEPPPNVTLPAVVSALACAGDDAACVREGSDLVAEMTGWVETPRVDNVKMLAGCATTARIGAKYTSGFTVFDSCVRERRQRTLWLPAAGFRLPKTGWLAFAWRDSAFCDTREGGCSVLGLVNLASGAMAAIKRPIPGGDTAATRKTEVLTGTVPVKTAQETALLALLAPHVAPRGVAITADVPPEFRPPPGARKDDQKSVPDRFVTMSTVPNRTADRWAWLSPTGEVWATGLTGQSRSVGNLALGHIYGLSRELKGRCPPKQPRPDLEKVYAALGDEADGATLSAMRAAVDRCAAGR